MKRYLALLAAVWLMLGFAWLYEASADEQSLAQATVTVRRGDLNGRQDPDIHSPKAARFQNGEIINVYEVQGDWALTDGGETGTCWVHIDYLTTGDAGTYTVNSNGRLRVRSTPDGGTVGWLKSGQTVEVVSVFGNWARTESGWVMAEYLKANK